MLNQKELVIMSHFRENARKNLTKISKETGIPVSTIFDKLKRYEGCLIKKHTVLLDFSKLGYDIRVNIVLKVPKQNRELLREFLIKKQEVNSVYRINNGYDFLIEAIFRNMKEANDFTEALDQFKIKGKEEYYILDDIKREAFMSDPEFIKAVGI